jgi:RHH-type rel operon transcriptional repressor/antitoxin RelB
MATTVRLEPATEQRLDQLAQLTGRTKAFVLRQLIEAGLDDLEDAYRGAVVAERGERAWPEGDQLWVGGWKGLIRLMPAMASKSLVLRVIRVRSWRRAVDAINASMDLIQMLERKAMAWLMTASSIGNSWNS